MHYSFNEPLKSIIVFISLDFYSFINYVNQTHAYSKINQVSFLFGRFQVGTLDQLVGLSDDLGKLDGYVESITRKVATYLGEVLEDQRDKLQENLLANNSK